MGLVHLLPIQFGIVQCLCAQELSPRNISQYMVPSMKGMANANSFVFVVHWRHLVLLKMNNFTMGLMGALYLTWICPTRCLGQTITQQLWRTILLVWTIRCENKYERSLGEKQAFDREKEENLSNRGTTQTLGITCKQNKSNHWCMEQHTAMGKFLDKANLHSCRIFLFYY